jgi:hypothetical protein
MGLEDKCINHRLFGNERERINEKSIKKYQLH